MIDQAERQAGSVRQTLENIQRVDEAGLNRNSPKHPRTPRATERHKYYAKDDMQVMYGESQERIVILSSYFLFYKKEKKKEKKTKHIYLSRGDRTHDDTYMCQHQLY